MPDIDISKDIHSLSDFKRNTTEFVSQMRESGHPVVLTINGKAELVVQDAAAYQKLLDKFPETHYGPWAKHRLEELKKPETGEFYAWFRKAKPAPPERPKPQDVKPGELPNVKLTPEEGDPLAPSSSGTTPVTPETKPAEGTPAAPEAPATEGTPAKPDAPATEAKPAETPAAPEAPATEKPAAEVPATEAGKPAEAATEKGTEPAPEAPKP